MQPDQQWHRRHLPLAQMTHTCALDVADQGTHDLQEIGDFMGLGYERVRQIYVEALDHALELGVDLRSFVDPEAP